MSFIYYGAHDWMFWIFKIFFKKIKLYFVMKYYFKVIFFGFVCLS